MMERQTYESWWPLHRRVACGDALSEDERARYEAGLRALEAEETNPLADLRELRAARERVAALQGEYARLQETVSALSARISAEEERLSEPTRQLLGIGG